MEHVVFSISFFRSSGVVPEARAEWWQAGSSSTAVTSPGPGAPARGTHPGHKCGESVFGKPPALQSQLQRPAETLFLLRTRHQRSKTVPNMHDPDVGSREVSLRQGVRSARVPGELRRLPQLLLRGQQSAPGRVLSG